MPTIGPMLQLRLVLLLGLLGLACLPARVRVAPGEDVVQGYVALGFEEVAQVFRENFERYGEYGAACCVYWRGEKVVDIWGGYRDIRTRAPWGEHILVPVYSTTKGLAAMCLALLHSRGLLDYDKPVAHYWPEFAAGGKESITVRQLLDHEAGLCCLDQPLRVRDIADLDKLAVILARQRPAWPPGERRGYHTTTLGLYMNELVRRVDPKHRSLGRFLCDEIAGPLGGEFYIGLPDSIPDSRIARVVLYNPPLVSVPRRMLAGLLNPRSLFARSLPYPRDGNINAREYQRVEQPSVNGIGEVRLVARAYGEFATGGKTLGLARRTLDELEAAPVDPPGGPIDAVLRESSYFRLGFAKPGPRGWFGSSARAYGMPGLGGSIGFADPDKELGFAYAPNRLGYNLGGDDRRRNLAAAVYRSVARLEQR